jgi:hypothetical protein
LLSAVNAAMQPLDNPDLALAEDMADMTYDPVGFCGYAYPWGEGSLEGSSGLRGWQVSILDYIGAHLSNPATRNQPCLIAVSSGHDIGKSALISMVVNWGMSTCEDCRVTITANTGAQLATKTVPEVTKWFNLCLNKHWFSVKSESITSIEPGHEKLWRADFLTWSEENTEAFQGLHNKGKRIIIIYDEASAIADTVWNATEGVLLDEDTEIIWLAFGNPTQNTGRFRQCFGNLKHRWKTFQIDSRTVEGVNKEQIDKWIADYGEDSDFVRVRVKGEFPRAGSTQLIPGDVVAACRQYEAEGFDTLPKILSCDVARFGDDQTVIGIRQGRKFSIVDKYRGLSLTQTAERLIEHMDIARPDATVIDGDGMGAGVIDHLEYRGYTDRIFEFHGGETPDDTARYFNKRAEVWGLMSEALRAGMEIPDDPELETDLTGPQYGYNAKQQIQLERKEDMKKRGLSSPDLGDALAMTFAVTVNAPPRNKLLERAKEIPDLNRRIVAIEQVNSKHPAWYKQTVPVRRPKWRPH